MCLSFLQSPPLVSLLQNFYHEAPCRLPTCDLIFTFSFPLAKASGCFYRYTGLPWSLSLQLSQHFCPWACLQMTWLCFSLSSSWQLIRFLTFLINAVKFVLKLPLESILIFINKTRIPKNKPLFPQEHNWYPFTKWTSLPPLTCPSSRTHIPLSYCKDFPFSCPQGIRY